MADLSLRDEPKARRGNLNKIKTDCFARYTHSQWQGGVNLPKVSEFLLTTLQNALKTNKI